MNGFMSRIERLATMVRDKQDNMVKVFYRGGDIKSMAAAEAVVVALMDSSHAVERVECPSGCGEMESLINAALASATDDFEALSELEN